MRTSASFGLGLKSTYPIKTGTEGGHNKTLLIVLLNFLDGLFFTVLLVGKFSTITTGLVATIEKWTLTGASACEPTIFFGPYLYGDTGKCQCQQTDGQE
jgi:hypothetical protein